MKNWKENLQSKHDELFSFYNSDFFTAEIGISFYGSSTLNNNQENLVNQIIENEKEWGQKIIEPLLNYYNKTYEAYKKGWELGGVDNETIEQLLPKEMTKEKLQKLTSPNEICIKPEEEHKEGSFGLGLWCSWDEERGLGIAFKNWEVVDVGHISIAYM